MKITWNGEPLKYVYVGATKWEMFKYRVRRFVRKCLIVTAVSMAVGVIAFAAFAIGARAAQPAITQITDNNDVPAVLLAIAKCESGNSQFNRNGQVLMHWNKNGTVDIGGFGINQVWEKQATKLGLDLTKAADNLAMAKWLYQNKGTQPWYSSDNCWVK